MKQISLIVGSNGKNLILAKAFQEHLESLGNKVHLVDLVSHNLPLYSSAQHGKLTGAEVLAPFKEALASEAFVFIAPEFNGGIPPVLTNFIAWASTSAKDWRVHFNSKKAAIATHSGGDGQQLLIMLRLQLAYIGMTVVGRQININDRKPVDPATIADVCKQLLA
ncbi:MAG: NADPH-dependent FMN reductase [Bacteriovoracia bacterium]